MPFHGNELRMRAMGKGVGGAELHGYSTPAYQEVLETGVSQTAANETRLRVNITTPMSRPK